MPQLDVYKKNLSSLEPHTLEDNLELVIPLINHDELTDLDSEALEYLNYVTHKIYLKIYPMISVKMIEDFFKLYFDKRVPAPYMINKINCMYSKMISDMPDLTKIQKFKILKLAILQLVIDQLLRFCSRRRCSHKEYADFFRLFNLCSIRTLIEQIPNMKLISNEYYKFIKNLEELHRTGEHEISKFLKTRNIKLDINAREFLATYIQFQLGLYTDDQLAECTIYRDSEDEFHEDFQPDVDYCKMWLDYIQFTPTSYKQVTDSFIEFDLLSHMLEKRKLEFIKILDTFNIPKDLINLTITYL